MLHSRPDAAAVGNHDDKPSARRQYPPQLLQRFARAFGEFQRMHHQHAIDRGIRQRQLLVEHQRGRGCRPHRPVHRPLPGRHEGEGALGIRAEAVEVGNDIAEPDKTLLRQTRPERGKRCRDGLLREASKLGMVELTKVNDIGVHRVKCYQRAVGLQDRSLYICLIYQH